jgi:hypothetical protein
MIAPASPFGRDASEFNLGASPQTLKTVSARRFSTPSG